MASIHLSSRHPLLLLFVVGVVMECLAVPMRAQLRQLSPEELVTRTFKLDARTIGRKFPFSTSKEAPKVLAEGTAAAFTANLREVFAAVGVIIENDPFSPQARVNENAMFFNDRTGELLIRATAKNFERIEPILTSLTPRPPQVAIETKYAETPAPSPYVARPSLSPTLSILTEKEFRDRIQLLEQQTGTTLVVPPQVITLSGRQARLRVEDSKQPVNFQTPPRLPFDTAPDADPTPRNRRALPVPPTISFDRSLIIRGGSNF